MPPKQLVTIQSWSAKRNDEQLTQSKAKFPPVITPDKQKQKLFIDAYIQTCAQLQIAYLPCFQNLAQHPGTILQQVTVHSAQLDVASSLAIGHALSECTDAQSVIFRDCAFTRGTVSNVLHFIQKNALLVLVFDKIQFDPQVFALLLQCLAFNRCSVKFIDCQFDVQRLCSFISSETCDLQYLSIIDRGGAQRHTFAIADGCLTNLKGIELFGVHFQQRMFEQRIPLLRAARQALLRSLFSQEQPKFLTQEYAKQYQKYALFAAGYSILVRANQQKWCYENETEEVAKDAIYEEFVANATTSDEMLIEYISMNPVFEEFTGTESDVTAFRRLEYVGSEIKCAQSRFYWDGKSASVEKQDSCISERV